jgi:dipeptidyl aminopeptidase/acylaminoacyl peptidase
MRTILPLMLLPLPALAMTEEVVTIPSQGVDMVGTLALPEGDPAPVVLLFHGFTGTRDELPVTGTEEGVLQRTARMLAEAGYASLRIDFVGSGESGGEWADTTFEGQIGDALAALDWVEGNARVDGNDVFLLGWSQGGLVAQAVAGRAEEEPKAVALWAAVADPMATFTSLLGEEAMQAGLATGDTPYEIALPWGATTALRQPYFEGVESFDPLAEIAHYDGPLFVAQGALDTVVLPESADRIIAAHEGPEELWVRDMDHAFNALTDAATLDEMIAATIAFFDAAKD